MDASCKIQRSIHDVRLTYKYVSRILGTYHKLSGFLHRKELENVEKYRTYYIACRTSSGYHKKAVGMHA